MLKIISNLSAKIPFSYFWIMRRCFEGNIKTVLDIGSNDGRFLEHIFAGDIPKLEYTGVDMYDDYLEGAKKKKIYKHLVKQDVTKKKWQKIDGKKYDLILCSQLIEHMKKNEGNAMLDKFEKLSPKRIVVSTPNGFQKFNPLEEEVWDEYESNYDQSHKSGWSIEDFENRGYKVYGQGLNAIYGADSFIRKIPKFTHPLFFAISFALSPLVYFYPQIAYILIAIKEA